MLYIYIKKEVKWEMMNLTDQNFEREISNNNKPVIVDFWAESCTPCLVLSPILEKLAEEYKDKFIFAKANLTETPLTARKYGIEIIPQIILFQEGKPVGGFIGARPEPIIRDWLERISEAIKPKAED